MRIFAVAMIAMFTMAGVAQSAVTLVSANFYDSSSKCEKGARIKKEDSALKKDGEVFVLTMGDRLETVVFLGFEVTRPAGADTSVIVVWEQPRNSWCQGSKTSLYVVKRYNEKTVHQTYHTRACRTLYVVPERNSDCKGDWVVTILDADGNVLVDEEGKKAVFTIRVQ